jgi:hypothetical protein
MKKKFTITFTVDASYPYIHSDNCNEKTIEKLAKDFDKWLKEWAMMHEDIVPVLYKPNRSGAIEHDANATVRVKIKRDKEVILDTWWDVLSRDF